MISTKTLNPNKLKTDKNPDNNILFYHIGYVTPKSEKNLIGSTNNNSDYYNERDVKIKFNSDDDLPLKRTLEFHNIIILVRSVFHEGNKYYQQFFLGDFLN